MIVDFIGQPFEDEGNLHDFLNAVSSDDATNSLRIVTAWAKRSGLRRIAPALRGFRDRGGRSQVVVGIDEGGATRQGLELALELFEDVRVFHDPTRRTFHPKMYVAQGSGSARLFLGSNNLTAGGVFFNYEAALDVRLDLGIPEDADLLRSVDTYVDQVISETELCLRLDGELLGQLSNTRALRIQDEDSSRLRRSGEPEDVDQTGAETSSLEEDQTPFGRAHLAKRQDPAPPERADAAVASERRTREAEPTPSPQTPEPVVVAEPAPATYVVRRWTKELARSDAQQPSPGSNPTGNLRLTRAGHQVDWRTFFRHDLFAPASWTPDMDSQGNPIEVARVAFDVVIDGTAYGTHELNVDHGPHREAGQANHVTVLHWGDLTSLLSETSHVGKFVVIERHSDDTYRLEIRPDAPPAIL